MNAKIIGVGSYLPEKILTNEDLEKMVDTSDEWITKRVGIKERHISRDDEFASDMAVIAAKQAIERSGLDPLDINMIICATVSFEYISPTVSCVVQKELGATNACAIDINTGCSGFVYAMIVADQFIKTGAYKNILVVGVDTLTKYTDWTERTSCVLFGDGAGAAVLSASEEKGIIDFELGADGAGGHVLSIPNLKFTEEDIAKRNGKKERTFWMDGSEVFKFAVRTMADSTKRLLAKNNMTIDDIDLLIPHQANTRIISGAAKRLGIDKEKVFENIQHTGNMSAACIPVALCEAMEQGIAKKGDKIIIVGFGGGLTWASALLEL